MKSNKNYKSYKTVCLNPEQKNPFRRIYNKQKDYISVTDLTDNKTEYYNGKEKKTKTNGKLNYKIKALEWASQNHHIIVTDSIKGKLLEYECY